jgi:hypothetical protein
MSCINLGVHYDKNDFTCRLSKLQKIGWKPYEGSYS